MIFLLDYALLAIILCHAMISLDNNVVDAEYFVACSPKLVGVQCAYNPNRPNQTYVIGSCLGREESHRRTAYMINVNLIFLIKCNIMQLIYPIKFFSIRLVSYWLQNHMAISK